MPAISYTAFYAVTVCQLAVALVLALRVAYLLYRIYSPPSTVHRRVGGRRMHTKVHDLLLVHLLMLLPSVETLVNFAPRDLYALIDGGELETSDWCTFSAFSSTASLCARAGNGIAVAYFTMKVVSSPSRRTTQYRAAILRTTAAVWASGLLVAVGYNLGGIMGPFRGLFCCVTRLDMVATSLMGAVVYVSMLVCSSVFFYRAVQAVEKARARITTLAESSSRSMRVGVSAKVHPAPSPRASAGGVSVSDAVQTPPSAINAPMDATLVALADPKSQRQAIAWAQGMDGQRGSQLSRLSSEARPSSRRSQITSRVRTSASSALLLSGIWLVSTFAVSWSVIVFASLAEYAGTSVSDEVFMVSVWLLKLLPISDFLRVGNQLQKKLDLLVAVEQA